MRINDFFYVSASVLALVGLAAPASAQRSRENVLRSAQDAFGSSIGNESIGIYSSGNVRGFSPLAAGNVRLEGLYFDPAVGFNGRVIRGSTVRVGISAQGYPFPAPTGIADFRLRLPGEEAAASVVGAADSFGSTTLEVDGQLPLIPGKLALGGGAHISRDEFHYGGDGAHRSAAAILRWQPAEGVEVTPFWSGFRHDEMGIMPMLLGNGTTLPPEIERRRNLTQRWSDYSGEDVNYGVIARWGNGQTKLATGLFRSVAVAESQFSDMFANISSAGRAGSHMISGGPDRKAASTSGELRLSHSLVEGERLHTLHLSARGRDNRRRYGGLSTVEMGPVVIDEIGELSRPAFNFGPQTNDHVEQMSGGIGYEGRWAGVGELTLGLQRTDYSKTVRAPGRPEIESTASPWLYNAGLALQLSDRLGAYGGYTRGLEESPIAPSFATNRDEAPPAILTKQYDAGIRWTINTGTRLVAGVFNVEKPYFNLDNARLFRRLGDVRHRGVEMSLTSQVTPQLSLLAGAVLMDAKVLGEAVKAGIVGEKPVRSTGETFLLSAEYRPPFLEGLSFDMGFNHNGKRVANSANTLFVPSSQNVNLGARYAFKMNDTPMSLRLFASNLLNGYNWDVHGSNAFFYNSPRQLSLRLAMDL